MDRVLVSRFCKRQPVTVPYLSVGCVKRGRKKSPGIEFESPTNTAIFSIPNMRDVSGGWKGFGGDEGISAQIWWSNLCDVMHGYAEW